MQFLRLVGHDLYSQILVDNPFFVLVPKAGSRYGFDRTDYQQ